MQKSILPNLLAVNNVSTSLDRKYKIYFIAKLFTYLQIFYLYYLNFFICIIWKENIRNFQKLLTYFLCDNICSENFLCYHKTCFREKPKFYLFCYNTILKDHMLFKWTYLTYLLFNLVEYWNWIRCSQKTCLFKFRLKVCNI